MTTNQRPCPIWEPTPSAQDIEQEGGLRNCRSPRAGGRFVLKQSGAALLHRPTDRQKANLSYWIYKHNLDNGVFDDRGGTPLVVDRAWVEGHRDRTPSAEDRMLNFLREMIRRVDAGKQRLDDDLLNLLKAAGGCGRDEDLVEMQRHAAEMGWIAKRSGSGFSEWHRINFPARIHVEERTRKLDEGRQGFVAMWFDPSMDDAYDHGIKPAICDAGYQALLPSVWARPCSSPVARIARTMSTST